MADSDIQGTVTDADGNVVQGATVSLFKHNGEVVAHTTTDANGQYVFNNHPDGDGSSTDWHVVARYDDGNGNYNAFSKPYVDASLGPAIPDSVVAQNDLFAYWGISEGSGQTISEPVNDFDGAINGATWESSANWHEGQAIVGDGTDDYVDATTLGSFGSKLTNDFALALTYRIDSNDLSNNQSPFGVDESTQQFTLLFNDFWGLLFSVIDENGNQIQHTTRTASNVSPSVGTRERLVINKPSNVGSDWEMYINGSEVATANDGDNNEITSTVDFSNVFYYLARNSGGVSEPLDGAIDNFAIWTDSLSNQEITDDYNNQPWS